LGGTLAGGGFDLTISGGGAFAAAVSGLDVFLADRIDTESTLSATSVTVTGASDLGGDVTTTKTQVYTGAVLLTGDVVFQSSGTGSDGDITFGSTLDGGFAATVTTAGTTTFEGDVGQGPALTSLTTDGGGMTVIDTANVTAGTIDFQDNVSIAQTTTVTGTASVNFGGTIAGMAGSESLTVVSSGTATFADTISNLDDVTVDAAGLTTFLGDIDITGDLSTIGGNVTKIDTASITAGTVNFSDAVELCQDLTIRADSITFGSTLDEAAGAVGSDLTLTITNPNAATGDIMFVNAVGGTTALDSLTITTANDVTFQSTVRLVGNLDQQAGTGTTAFNGTSGTGIGGQLLVTTNEVTFSTSDIVTVGLVVISAQNAITFNASAGLNAGNSTITLNANQDNTGAQGLTQASGTIIRTTSNAATAITIDVDGAGSAAISDLRAGTTTGAITITAGGSITDNSSGEGANLTAAGVALTAGTGIGGSADADIDTTVANLEALTTSGGIVIQETDAITLGGVNGTLSGVDVTTSGNIVVTANGSITVSEQISGPDHITLTALGTTSDLTIQVNSGVMSTDGDVLLSADRTVTISENVSTTGTGSIKVSGHLGAADEGARNIVVNSGAIVSTEDGDLTLDADQGTTQSGSFTGIVVDGMGTKIQVAGSGNLTLTGRGGNAVSNQVGIAIQNDAVVSGGTSGSVMIQGFGGGGIGGPSTVFANNYGVSVTGANSQITSAGGNVTVAGHGGVATALSSGVDNYGVYIAAGGMISAGGMGTVAINGSGGDSLGAGGRNYGVFVTGVGSQITSSGGDVTVTGHGGSSGSSALGNDNVGVHVANQGVISAGLLGAVTVDGTGGDAVGIGENNYGVFVTGTGSQISSSGGDVQVTGQGGNAANVNNDNNNHGVFIANAGVISAGGTGAVTVDGTGGDGTDLLAGSNHGVYVTGTGSQITSAGGDVQVTGRGGATSIAIAPMYGVYVTAGGQITSAGNVTVTGIEGTGNNSFAVVITNSGSISSTGGDVTVIGNSLVIDGSSSISAGTGMVTILQRTNGVAIDLGSGTDTVGGPLALSDAELDRITAGELHIGNASSGAITVSSDIALTNNAPILCLTTGSTVTATAGGIVVQNLAITAGGAVTVTDDTTDVDQVAITTTTGNATFEDADGFTVGSVCNVDGIRTAAGSVTLVADTGNITVMNTAAAMDVAATTGITITLSANDALFTVNSGANLTNSTSNGVSISADKMDLGGTIAAANQTVTLQNSVGADAIDLGSATDNAANTLELSDAELDGITASKLVIGSATMGAITVSSDIDLTNNVTTLRLNTGSTVTATAGGIVVSDLAIVSGDAVTFTDATTNVTNLAIDAATGNIRFTAASGLTITTVDGVTGIDTNGGTVRVDVTTGNLTIADTAAANDIDATGAITLTVAANNGLFTINSGAVVNTTSGGVTVSADKMNLAGSISAAGQTVTLHNSVGADAIDLGSATDSQANTLELSDAELDRITADLLVIGSATTGAITVSSDIDLTDGPVIPTLHLITNSGVTGTAGGLVVANLAISANGAINISDADNDVDQLAVINSSTTTFSDKDDLTIGTVDGVVGITTTDDDVKLSTTVGNLVIDDDITLGSSDLTLNINGTVTQNSGDVITANGLQLLGTGAVNLDDANNDVSFLAVSHSGTVSYRDLNGLTIGTVTDTSMGTTTTNGITNDADVKLTTGGSLTIGDGTGTNDDVTLTGGHDLTLNVTGAVTQVADNVITASGLQLLGTGAVNLDDAGNNVVTLAIQDTTTEIEAGGRSVAVG